MEAVQEQKPEIGETNSGWQEIKEVLALRDFRLLWLGQGISLLGDQFALIALPWLVLQLTGDVFAMGIVLAFADSIWFAGLMLALTGVLDGWVMIQFTTWLQLRSPEALLGRIMGLLMFAFVGLAPVADALFGWLIEWDVTTVLLVSGVILALISFGAAFQPRIRAMGMEVAPAAGE